MAEPENPGGIDSDREALLDVLTRHRVAFVLIGGAAIQSHGRRYDTQDIDITPALSLRTSHSSPTRSTSSTAGSSPTGTPSRRFTSRSWFECSSPVHGRDKMYAGCCVKGWEEFS